LFTDWLFKRAAQLDSLMISVFPFVFTAFDGKRFSLLWRGTRDRFGAVDFHSRCDGHASTLTVMLGTSRNVFGGFTPVTWESRRRDGREGSGNSMCTADESLTSFVFTLKNRQKRHRLDLSEGLSRKRRHSCVSSNRIGR
jgi:hypothetical protein